MWRERIGSTIRVFADGIAFGAWLGRRLRTHWSHLAEETRVRPNFDEVIPRRNTDSTKYDDLWQRYGKPDLLPLWVADMDFRVPDCITRALRRLVDHGIYGYHLKGPKYTQAIVDWWARRHHYAVDPGHILFSPGVVPAISHLVQALTVKGDGIILQPPVYHPFFWAVRVNERRLLENRLREHGGVYSMDFDDLEAKARDAKLLILCNPHNPVGRVWRREELERIAEICLRHNVVILSDEIHNDLVFPPHRHASIAGLSPEVDRITITTHAASKTFNVASLSTAYMLIRDSGLRDAVKRVNEALHVEALNPFGLVATSVAFREGEPWLAALLDYLWGNYQFLRDFLADRLPRVKASPLEGTYLVWLDFRDYGFSNQALKDCMTHRAGLALNDGPMFGPGGEGFQRMNIACPRSVLRQALEQLAAALT
jgi:cystathionine beta-lyase